MKKLKVKKIIHDYELDNTINLIKFLKNFDSYYYIDDLKKIAELANSNRENNSAFYTNDFIVDKMISNIKILNKEKINVLEPAVGIGNFIIPFAIKLSNLYKEVNIDVNDIDEDSLRIFKTFVDISDIPKNVHINYYNHDFLSGFVFNQDTYDYVIGNPPFKRISQKESIERGYGGITNLSGEFLMKAMSISKIVSMIMPKNLLSTSEYKQVRNLLNKSKIQSIKDFGENGFKGVLIETVGIIAISDEKPNKTDIYSMMAKENNILPQYYITDPKYPTWLIYRNSFFDKIASNMIFNIFEVFRDRQITNKILSNNDSNSIRVIKSKNISRDGSKLIDIPTYDSFTNKSYLASLNVSKFFYNKNVYLVPNMTYYPRIIRKKANFIVNGSVAILIPKDDDLLTTKEINFINSKTFQRFYQIARNKSTRSLNINKASVFWFGKYIGDDFNG